MSARGALEGVKVADFSWAVAGPVSTKMLAVHGATVVKIESNLRLDGPRVAPPFRPKIGRNKSAYFTDINNTKYSIALNLGDPRGRDIARRLISWSDVVAENFSAGQMSEWGLGYEDLKKLKPSIIMISSSMQGQKGPHATHIGLGGTLGALVGLNHFTGWPDRQPLGPSIPYTDVIAPWFAATAVVAALEYRDRTGEGQYIDLSQFETTNHFLAPALLDYSVNGREEGRIGNSSPYWSPHGAYRCKGDDRWVAIAVTDDKQWEGFCKATGSLAWTAEPRFSTMLARVRASDEVDKLVETWTVNFTPEEAMQKLQAQGVPAGVVATARELHEDPQLKHMGGFMQIDHPEMGPHAHTHPSFWLSKTPAQFRPAPLLGQHNEYVYKTLLNMSDAEYAQLNEAGVFK